MGWSIKIARILGIDVKIHVTFFLLLIWIGLAYYWVGGIPAAIEGTLFILALFGCVLLHEFGHALAARWYGIPTPDITLLPIGGVARLQRMPDKPDQEIVVALAGPAVNVVIAGLILVYLGGFANLGKVLQLHDPEVGFLQKLMVVNIWLVLFNMLPAFPMDGGRVLRALLAKQMPYSTATQIAARIGQGMAFLFGLFGIFYNPFLILIALFIYLAASQEAVYAQIRDVSQDILVQDVMLREFIVLNENSRLAEAIDAVLSTAQREFPVISDQNDIVGILTREDIINGFKRKGIDTPIKEIMHTDIPTIMPHEGVHEALQKMNESGCPALIVVDRYGTVAGIISFERIGELMALYSVPRKYRRQEQL